MNRKNFQQSKVYFCHFTFHCIFVTQCDRSKKCVGWYVLLFYDENQWWNELVREEKLEED